MVDDSINYEYIIRYIREVLPKREGILLELEEYAKEYDVPISQPETIKFLELLIKLGNRKRILEIGSAIGYSAICMAEASMDGVIDTIELNQQNAEIARRNFDRACVSHRVNLYEGDANEILPKLATRKNQYDMIFVDAAKAQYMSFFGPCLNMLSDGGLLVSDNVLYKGMTATDDLVLHRKRTIVKRLREFIEVLHSNSELDTVVLPIGDGVAMSIKK